MSQGFFFFVVLFSVISGMDLQLPVVQAAAFLLQPPHVINHVK